MAVAKNNKRISVMLPRTLLTILEHEAALNGVSVSAMAGKVLIEWLELQSGKQSENNSLKQ